MPQRFRLQAQKFRRYCAICAPAVARNWRGQRGYGQTDWVSFSWNSVQNINGFEVYWWNNGGGVVVPNEARVEYWNGSSWISVGNIGVELNQFNRLEFANVQTNTIRVLMASDLSTGILETRVLETR